MLKSTVSTIGIDAKQLPLFTGYITYFAVRWFWFSYWSHLKVAFKNIGYGNMFKTLMSPFTIFIDVWKLTNIHVLKTMKSAFDAYQMFFD